MPVKGHLPQLPIIQHGEVHPAVSTHTMLQVPEVWTQGGPFAEGKKNVRDVETIMLPKTAKPTHANAPTAEMTTRHGTLTVLGG